MLPGIDGQPAPPKEAGPVGTATSPPAARSPTIGSHERRSVTGLGDIWSLIDIVLAWSFVAPEFMGVPILLAGRYPG